MYSASRPAPAEGYQWPYSLPHFATAPDDGELVLEHLRPRLELYVEKIAGFPTIAPWATVNSRLLRLNPWELPGMAQGEEQGKLAREKYFVTDGFQVQTTRLPRFKTSSKSKGYWRPRNAMGWGIRDKGDDAAGFVGLKRTYDFHRGDSSGKLVKTCWIMNVYYLINRDHYVERDLVLCHVFENKSLADCNDKRKEGTHREAPPMGNGVDTSMFQGLEEPLHHRCNQHPGVQCNHVVPMTRNRSFRSQSSKGVKRKKKAVPSDPELTAYLANLEKTLLGDTETSSAEPESYDSNGEGPSNSTFGSGENEHLGKQARSASASPVWESFTKVFEDGPDGVVLTYAVCNRCCKVLTGDSAKGTSHLIRHLKKHTSNQMQPSRLESPIVIMSSFPSWD